VGRRAVRNEVKRAKGNPGRRPIVEKAPQGDAPSEVVAEGSLPDWVNTARMISRQRPKTQKQRADFMTGLTRQVWDFAQPELVKMNLVKKIDEPSLAIWCRAMAEYIAAIIELDRDGTTYKTESAHSGTLYRLHPATRMRKEALQTLREYGDALGITPMSRQRLFQMMADAGRGALPIDRMVEDAAPVQAPANPVGLLSRMGGGALN
jgi:P27 family predicted phage terminase small subunit